MTDERPVDRLFREFGLGPPGGGPGGGPGGNEKDLEANRKELENKPPEPSPRDGPTLGGPGMNFKNPRTQETPEQREARLAKIEAARLAKQENEKKPEPPSLDKAAGRVEKIDEKRPARRMLAPWEKDPRWGA